MITLLLLCLPTLAALLLLLTKSTMAKQIALGAAVAELAFTVFALLTFTPDASMQFTLYQQWMPSLGINFNIGMDGISLLLVLLTSFTMPFIIYTSFRKQYETEWVYYALLLLAQSGLVGVFTSLNGFLFYLFWEVVLIPVYFLSAFWGGKNRVRVTFKFFIYTVIGSFFMLLGFIFLYLQTPAAAQSFDLEAIYALKLSQETQGWIFLSFFIAFAIKMPIFPFHTWQPDTYAEAPVSVTMILSALMVKMAVYGVFRWMLPVSPLALEDWGQLVIILSTIGIIYASCVAIMQDNLKRLVAYASIAHIGLIAAGIFSFNTQGLEGGVFQMLSHGIGALGLFYVIDLIESRTGTVSISQLGGIIRSAPIFGGIFLIILVSTIAMPLTNGFWGELLLLLGVNQYSPVLGALCVLTIVLGAVYMLRMYQNTIVGTPGALTQNFADVTAQEMMVLVPIVLVILGMGFFPGYFFNIAQPAVENILSNANNYLIRINP